MWVQDNTGVWTTNTYDALDRILIRQKAVGNPEGFGYDCVTGLLTLYKSEIGEVLVDC